MASEGSPAPSSALSSPPSDHSNDMDVDGSDHPATMPALPARVTVTMTTLSTMPPIREPVLRRGRSQNITRPSNLEAYMGQMAGTVQDPACRHCARRNGVWTQCVVVDGLFSGSCANCHYNNEGIRCSLRPAATPATVARAIQAAADADPFAPGPSSRAPTTPATIRGARTPAPAQTPATPTRRSRRIVPTNITPTPASRGRNAPAAASNMDTTGRVRVPRRSRAERMREIADHHHALAELYEEEADRLDEDNDQA